MDGDQPTGLPIAAAATDPRRMRFRIALSLMPSRLAAAARGRPVGWSVSMVASLPSRSSGATGDRSPWPPIIRTRGVIRWGRRTYVTNGGDAGAW